MTIVEDGDTYHAGDIDICPNRRGVQLHVDRHANFTWQEVRELAKFLLHLAEGPNEV